jgi:hypothetical protein
MVRFSMIEPIHLGLNLRLNIGVVYLWLIIFLVVGDVLIDSKTLFDRLCESQNQTGPVF